MQLHPENIYGTSGGDYDDVWDWLLNDRDIYPVYSRTEWERYLPLFTVHAPAVISELDRIQATDSAKVIPANLLSLMESAKLQIPVEAALYRRGFEGDIYDQLGTANSDFQYRFEEMLRQLSVLAQEAERLRGD